VITARIHDWVEVKIKTKDQMALWSLAKKRIGTGFGVPVNWSDADERMHPLVIVSTEQHREGPNVLQQET